VAHYLQRIEAVCKPDNFIICGRASVSFDKWWGRVNPLEPYFLLNLMMTSVAARWCDFLWFAFYAANVLIF
jgi:hypothetical protein